MKNPQRMGRLAFKTIGSETIILDTKIGKEVHQLNEVATFIWNHCDGRHSTEEISEKVCQEFSVDKKIATQDLEELIAVLTSKSLLET